MIKIKKLKLSFFKALKGIQKTYIEQQNFRIEVIIAVIVLLFAWGLQISSVKLAILIFTIALVLILELINTAFEHIVDILKPRIHTYAGIIKDILAGAVLISSIAAVIIGLIIFLPYLSR